MKTKFNAITYKGFLEELQQTDEKKLPQLIDECLEEYKQYLLGAYDGDTYQDGDEEIAETILMTQSPVERLFYVAMKNEASKFGIILEGGQILFQPQFKVVSGSNKYVVDFLLGAMLPSNRTIDLFIELDGHKYHNESKKKVAEDRKRERALQTSCDKIIVFTGSEIYEDPTGCASEVLRIFKRLLTKNGVFLM